MHLGQVQIKQELVEFDFGRNDELVAENELIKSKLSEALLKVVELEQKVKDVSEELAKTQSQLRTQKDLVICEIREDDKKTRFYTGPKVVVSFSEHL